MTLPRGCRYSAAMQPSLRLRLPDAYARRCRERSVSLTTQANRVLAAWTHDEAVRQAVAHWEAQLGTDLTTTMVTLAQRAMDDLAK